MAAAATFPSCSSAEEATVQQWVDAVAPLSAQAADPAKQTSILDHLNSHLAVRTTILGSKPSLADVAVYRAVAPLVRLWSPEARSGEHARPHIVRHLDFVQNSALFGLQLADQDKVPVDADDVRYVKPVLDAKAEKERLKKEKAAAAASTTATPPAAFPVRTMVPHGQPQASPSSLSATQNESATVTKEQGVSVVVGGQPAEKVGKEKKDKPARQPKTAAASNTLSPAMIDLRVGHILKAIKHPEADSLFVSTIAMGDPPGEDTTEFDGQICRTVCSGLNGLIPLEEMQGRRVVVVANLKPVKMRGVKSCAMVLAASPRPADGAADDHKGVVELVVPPADAPPGERVFFEGWPGVPETQLNPKKKVWETIQPGFTTTEALEVAFDAGAVKELGQDGLGRLVTSNGSLCTVPSLHNAQVR